MRTVNEQLPATAKIADRSGQMEAVRRSSAAIDAGLLLLTMAAVGIVLGRDITIGGLRYGDSAAHAMDGVLIHDWFAAGPDAWLQPIEFAERQYAHYPTLGIGRHYPPGFAAVEALFFAAFGISAVVARMTVLFFALVAAAAFYAIGRMLAGRLAGFFAAIVWITLPATVEWGRQEMLEVPTAAALALGAVAVLSYLRSPTYSRLFLALAAMVAALFFKQTSVFIFAAFSATLTLAAMRKNASASSIRWSHVLIAVLASIVAMVVVVQTLDGHGSRLLHGNPTYPDRWSWVVLTGYLQIVPKQVGWIVILIAGIGVVSLVRVKAKYSTFALRSLIFLCLWFIACWAMLTLSDFKYDRYLYPGLLPFAVFAGIGAAWFMEMIPTVSARVAVAAAVGLAACVPAWSIPTKARPDYGPAVAAHRQEMEGQAILFSGLRDGDFVFAVRERIPWRSAVVIRGSKLLYHCNGRPDLDFASHVASSGEIEQLMRRLAFTHVFIERENKLGLREDEWLRHYLESGGDYAIIASYPMAVADTPDHRNVTLDVYRLSAPLERQVGHVDLPIGRAGRTVRVELPAIVIPAPLPGKESGS